jgi:hypothetical protein
VRPSLVRAKIQLALEFGQPGQDGQHQPAMWCCAIGPDVGQRLEASASLDDRIEERANARRGNKKKIVAFVTNKLRDVVISVKRRPNKS